jgi:hypothetical protein
VGFVCVRGFVVDVCVVVEDLVVFEVVVVLVVVVVGEDVDVVLVDWIAVVMAVVDGLAVTSLL